MAKQRGISDTYQKPEEGQKMSAHEGTEQAVLSHSSLCSFKSELLIRRAPFTREHSHSHSNGGVKDPSRPKKAGSPAVAGLSQSPWCGRGQVGCEGWGAVAC